MATPTLTTADVLAISRALHETDDGTGALCAFGFPLPYIRFVPVSCGTAECHGEGGSVWLHLGATFYREVYQGRSALDVEEARNTVVVKHCSRWDIEAELYEARRVAMEERHRAMWKNHQARLAAHAAGAQSDLDELRADLYS